MKTFQCIEITKKKYVVHIKYPCKNIHMVKIKPSEISRKRSITNKHRISFFTGFSPHFLQFVFQLFSLHFYSNFNSIFIEKFRSGGGGTVEKHCSIFVRSF